MGWCSGTRIFDAVAKEVLSDAPMDKKAVLRAVIVALEDDDWDCQSDSRYFDDPTVREVMKETHPNWDWDA